MAEHADDDFASFLTTIFEKQRFYHPNIICFSGHRNRKNIPAPEFDSFEHGGGGHVKSGPIQAQTRKNVQTSTFEQNKNFSRDGPGQDLEHIDL